MDDYIKNFRQLSEEDTKIEGFIMSAEKTLQAIILQLKSRKQYLEKR
jgi:hypothetical protein